MFLLNFVLSLNTKAMRARTNRNGIFEPLLKIAGLGFGIYMTVAFSIMLMN